MVILIFIATAKTRDEGHHLSRRKHFSISRERETDRVSSLAGGGGGGGEKLTRYRQYVTDLTPAPTRDQEMVNS